MDCFASFLIDHSNYFGFGFTTLDCNLHWNKNQSNYTGYSQKTDNPVTQSKIVTITWREAREKLRGRLTIGFGFTSDWLRKWRKIFKPITKRSYAKPKKRRITFDSQVKIVLFIYGNCSFLEMIMMMMMMMMMTMMTMMTWFQVIYVSVNARTDSIENQLLLSLFRFKHSLYCIWLGLSV